MIGKTVLHYKILEKLGEGGMGIVYKAEDTKLERIVALKFLSATAIAGDEEKKRFKREAKAAAALNHPNIATIFAIDEAEPAPAHAGGQTFIAMEFIEGRSLVDLVTSPLPLDKAIDYATQIAAGLQAAHEKGVVHRDIKSANVMVTDKGVVKIMDFGLASLAGGSKVTQLGTTLGTAAYMPPEQARGEKVDHRADIWALGVVLYEMISGQLPFKGDYEQAVIYSILNEDPEPLTALRTGVPVALDGIVAKALAKERDTRYQHVDELPADLKAIDTASLSQSRISTMSKPSGASRPSKGSMLPWVIAALSLIGLVITLPFSNLWKEPAKQEATRLNLSALTAETQSVLRTDAGALALSPDGNTLVYTVSEDGQSQLYLRSLKDFAVVPIRGTGNAQAPFFSPNGQWIGFHADGQIKKVAISGGAVEIICDSPTFRGASWGADNIIVYSPEFNSGLMAVSAMGGPSRQISTLDTTKMERTHRWPQVLPDGKSVLYTIGDQNNPSSYDDARLAIQSLETGERHVLDIRGELARYVEPDVLIITRNGTLLAAPFNLKEFKTTQPPIPVVDNIDGNTGSGVSYFAISNTGRLVYIPGIRNREQELVWIDKQGKVEVLPLQRNAYAAPRISPDGTRIAVMIGESKRQQYDIWVYNLASGAFNRFTFENRRLAPVWSPDGKTLYFSSDGGAVKGILAKPADGSSAEALLWATAGAPVFPVHVSPDGEKLMLNLFGGPTEGSIVALDLSTKQGPDTLFFSGRLAYGGDQSPDGRFLTYGSNETGALEIFVTSFPDLRGKWQVSSESGLNPLWSPNGKELYYVSESAKMMAVTLSTDPVFSPGKPRELFDVSQMSRLDTPFLNYDIAPDGKRFIMVRNAGQNTSPQNFNVILNWMDEVRDRLKGGE